MNPWTVYWLFKLDDIQAFLLLPMALSIANIVWSVMSSDDWNNSNEKNDENRRRKMKMPLLYLGIFCVFLSVIIPSTKTIAAIIVLPRIASAENLNTLSRDAGDIYTLAMSKLKDVIGEQAAKSEGEK